MTSIDNAIREHLSDITHALKLATSGSSYELTTVGVQLPRADGVAVAFYGFIQMPTAGAYTFATASDGGSLL